MKAEDKSIENKTYSGKRMRHSLERPQLASPYV